MKKKIGIFVMLVSLSLFGKENREVNYFNQIEINGGGEAYITQGEKESLFIEGDEEVIKYVKTYIRNNKLIIEIDKPWYKLGYIDTKTLKYHIVVKDLNEYESNGSIDTFISSLESDNFELEVNGSGDVSIGEGHIINLDISISGSGEVEVGNLVSKSLEYESNGSGQFVGVDLAIENAEFDMNGSGEVTISGMGNSVEVEVSGSGHFEGKDFVVQNGKLEISGSGKSSFNIGNSLELDIQGSGEVDIYGEGKITKASISGSGSYNRK